MTNTVQSISGGIAYNVSQQRQTAAKPVDRPEAKETVSSQIATVALFIICSPLLLSGCSGSSSSSKNYGSLSKSEKGAVLTLLRKALEETVDLRQYGTYYSTVSRINPVTKKTGNQEFFGLTAVTQHVSLMHQKPNWRRELEEALNAKSVSWTEDGRNRRVSLEKFAISTDAAPGMGHESFPGDMMGITRETITIFPLRIKTE
ncbi:MAG: hypothetical protein NTZ10_01030 [Candidatus Saganbacteria bacterium]|nr:hypothetical protein [Candidatus Saganbacteria bacterium]